VDSGAVGIICCDIDTPSLMSAKDAKARGARARRVMAGCIVLFVNKADLGVDCDLARKPARLPPFISCPSLRLCLCLDVPEPFSTDVKEAEHHRRRVFT
jgi:hypothetical protein